MSKITLWAVLLLSASLFACRPVPPAGSGDDPDLLEIVVTEAPPPDSDGESIDPGILNPLDTDNSGSGAEGPAPIAEWDRSPEALILHGTFCCGFVPQLVPINYVPDFSIWGDGRIVWTSYHEEAPRRMVWEAHIDETAMQQLIGQIISAGFFSWDTRYANNTVADFADKCLLINVSERSHTVCEYFEGAPDTFHVIYEQLNTGYGLRGREYIPTEGLLIARAFSGSDVETFKWDASRSGISIADAGEPGTWVDALSVQEAWAAVNANPWAPFVQENGLHYQVTIQIPGLSMTEPPAR